MKQLREILIEFGQTTTANKFERNYTQAILDYLNYRL